MSFEKSISKSEAQKVNFKMRIFKKGISIKGILKREFAKVNSGKWIWKSEFCNESSKLIFQWIHPSFFNIPENFGH